MAKEDTVAIFVTSEDKNDEIPLSILNSQVDHEDEDLKLLIGDDETILEASKERFRSDSQRDTDIDTDYFVPDESNDNFSELTYNDAKTSNLKSGKAWQKPHPRRNSCFDSSCNDINHFCAKLYHTKRKMLHLKNYHDEARAMRDISKFLKHPIVLFKIHYTLWEDIAREMIVSLSEQKPNLNLDVTQALKSVICKDADFVIPECVQGISDSAHGPITEQSFITVIGTTNSVSENQVVMCLLKQPFNFGNGAEEIRFVCLILSPLKHTKHTKSALEVARTYSTLLADDRLRRNLLNTHSPEEFAHEFELECSRIQIEHQKRMKSISGANSLKTGKLVQSLNAKDVKNTARIKFSPGRDMINDIKSRAKHYLSDYIDDVKDGTSIQKIISTTLFLYFALLLPGVAFGVLHSNYTDKKIDSQDVVIAQALGGLLFSIFSGQHLVVLSTTIPVVIYTKIVYIISKNWAEDGSFFYTFYAMTGLSNSFFLIMYAISGASKIMAYCSRSTEEILEVFISVAFVVDSVKFISKQFEEYYCFTSADAVNQTAKMAESVGDDILCDPTKPILTVLLVFVTVYVGVQIFNFKNSPYLTAGKRLLVADYALVVAVAAGAFIGSYCFQSVELTKFEVKPTKKAIPEFSELFRLVEFHSPPTMSVFSAIGLGFVVSLLFFMEGNISASIVNKPSNKLKKGPSFHYDMFVTGMINAILSIFCLPWVHGALPHSPLHVRALADIEEHIENGHVTENIVFVRETRLTTLFSHIMIGISAFLMIPYPVNIIPIPVLYGLFIFLAITALGELQIWERFVLIFTEQSLYPPFHYVRRVPQKIIHCFTLLQLLQLTAICLISFGGSVYWKMLFPFLIVALIPIREWILPKIISNRHLVALDGQH